MKHDQAKKKKPYEKPELSEYGDLRLLTEQALSTMGAVDGSFYGMTALKTGG